VCQQEMHQWSSSSEADTTRLLQLMLQGEEAAVQALHDRAAQLVHRLEEELQQVAEPVVVFWLKASAYHT